MTADVKICGLKTPETLEAALAAGAAYVGLVFYEPSPRNVEIEQAAQLAEQVQGRARTVALFVDPDDALFNAVVTRVKPDIVQLHGSEQPQRIAELRKRTSAEFMKAVKVATAEDVATARTYVDTVDMILFDAKAPATVAGGSPKSLPGGNGERFDWSLLNEWKGRSNWILSGGLDATNVVDAIRQTQAPAIDVSSGVERARGEKDCDLIAAFVAAAASANKTDQGVRDRVQA